MELLTINEAAKVLRISEFTLRKRISAREISFRKFGKFCFLTNADIQAYIEASAVPMKNGKEGKK